MRAYWGTLFSRTISRCVPEIVSRIPSSESATKRVYLTFDDGPTAAGTPALLDVLAEHDVRATFFLLGENAQHHPELVEATLAAGHEIGNHTHTHIDAWKQPAEAVGKELDLCTETLEEMSGQSIRWIRPPFGRVTKSIVQWSRQQGQRLILWDIMPPDFEPTATIESVSANLMRGVRNGSIIVLHDNAKALPITAHVLERCLPQLKAEGYRFSLLSMAMEPSQNLVAQTSHAA